MMNFKKPGETLRKRAFCICILVLFLGSTQVSANQNVCVEVSESVSKEKAFMEGLNCESAGNYDQAKQWYLKSYDEGLADAATNIGAIHESGNSGKRDFRSAAAWYKRAKELGSPAGYYNLGKLFRNGRGVDHSPSKGIGLIEKAARMGLPHAQLHMGDEYYFSDVLKRDIDKAIHWYGLASDNGLAEAQYKLASIYFKGKYTEEDLSHAYNLLRQAESQGHGRAKLLLAIFHLKGLGGAEKNIWRALHLLRVASQDGVPEASFNLGHYYLCMASDPDKESSKYWFGRAAEMGYEKAKRAIALDSDELLGLCE